MSFTCRETDPMREPHPAEAHGITKRYRSPKRLLLKRADLDRALDGAPRRRNAVKKAQAA